METIRSECLKFCIGFTALIGLTLLYEGIWSLDTGLTSGIRIVSSLPADIWIACACFCCGALLAVNLRLRSSQAASWALCVFTAAGLFAILIDAETPYGVLGFLLPILFSAFLFNWKEMTLFSGLTLAASVYLEIINFSGSFPVAKAVPPVLVVLAVAVFLQLTIHPILSVIDWYEKKYVIAHQNEQIIRENEIELERLVKSLADSRKYLRTANDQLIKARDEAEKAKNVKQIFVQTVSHELRTPLNLIIGFSETMVHTPGNYGEVNWTPELKGDIECIYQNSQHLKSLIDDVLDLAALENQKYDIHPETVDLVALINEVVLFTEPAYKAKGLTLETDLRDESLMVYADGVRIKQVILNLFSNALKYTAQGGVVISARQGESWTRVIVQDTGKGIPVDAQDKVFEAFYQVDKSTNREDSGTGLGLSISKQLIELHGGEMGLNSTLGKGTAVYFTVPLLQVEESYNPPE